MIQAKQTYIRSSIVRRTATCSMHERQSSDFRGIQQDMFNHKHFWAFYCKSKGGHIFLAVPDGSAPQTAKEAAEWQQQQEAERAGIDYDAGGR